MEKAELGSRIANETAASLAEIVSGINESTQIVSEIAKSSEEQNVGIDQVNKGIDQVAQIVQQTSKTAQESASASEGMSNQAHMLEDLIVSFKSGDISSPAPRAKVPVPANRQIAMPEQASDYGKY
jgi:methyl-accepting chemotaxis protein